VAYEERNTYMLERGVMAQSKHTLLVAGGAGFIGSSFVELAIQSGYYVVVLDALTYAGHPENLQHLPANAHQLVVGNICDGALVCELFAKHQPSAVVNFAAESHVDNSILSPSSFIETNITGVFTLLEAARQYWNGLDDARKAAFRFVQISTDEVYGSLGETGKFTETTAMKPNSPYSASKAAGDHLVRAWFKTYGLPGIVTNCSNNYGPRQFPEKLIPLMISRAVSGGVLPIYGDGKNVRDWIHVEDHARGLLLALEQGKPGQTYCFGGNEERNNNQVVQAICALLDEVQPRADGKSYAAQIDYVKDRPGHDRRYAIDDSKAQQELGFTRQYDFTSGLRQTVEWYLGNAAWAATVIQKAKVA
jgi:dTDP-glucose 4,6-dehydratase